MIKVQGDVADAVLQFGFDPVRVLPDEQSRESRRRGFLLEKFWKPSIRITPGGGRSSTP